jgi:hypothetical protein
MDGCGRIEYWLGHIEDEYRGAWVRVVLIATPSTRRGGRERGAVEMAGPRDKGKAKASRTGDAPDQAKRRRCGGRSTARSRGCCAERGICAHEGNHGVRCRPQPPQRPQGLGPEHEQTWPSALQERVNIELASALDLSPSPPNSVLYLLFCNFTLCYAILGCTPPPLLALCFSVEMDCVYFSIVWTLVIWPILHLQDRMGIKLIKISTKLTSYSIILGSYLCFSWVYVLILWCALNFRKDNQLNYMVLS